MKQRECRNGIGDGLPVGQGGGGDAHDVFEEAGGYDCMPLPRIMNVGQCRYGMSDSTKSPASGLATVSEPSLTSQVRPVREVVCA